MKTKGGHTAHVEPHNRSRLWRNGYIELTDEKGKYRDRLNMLWDRVGMSHLREEFDLVMEESNNDISSTSTPR